MDADAEMRSVDESNDDDPVIKEFDVYLNRSNLSSNNLLYILQFPIKPNDRPNDYKNYSAAKIKPFQNKMELEIELDTQSDYYSRTKGEQFALNVDGKQQPAAAQKNPMQHQQPPAKYYKSNLMDKQIYSSSNAAPNQINKFYMLGLMKTNSIHLTPVQSVLQMRQNFEYFDIYEQKVKDLKESQQTGAGGEGNDYSTEEEAEQEPEKTELVTMKYSLKTTKQLQQQQFENEQKWIKINFDNQNSGDSNKEIQESIQAKSRDHFLTCKSFHNRISINSTNEDLINRYIVNSLAAAAAAASASAVASEETSSTAASSSTTATTSLKSSSASANPTSNQSGDGKKRPAQKSKSSTTSTASTSQSIVIPKLEPKQEKHDF